MFEKQINCGVEFLNTYRPNWLNLIDIDLLDMTMPQFCILGQIGDDFYYVRTEMNLSMNDTDQMGFTCPNLDDEVWSTLTKEWKDKIVSLRNETSQTKD
jgi:hypothetical protein